MRTIVVCSDLLELSIAGNIQQKIRQQIILLFFYVNAGTGSILVRNIPARYFW